MNLERLVANACEIQKIPAPTFSEQDRAQHLKIGFQRAGLIDILQDDVGNVFGRTPGQPVPAIVVSAHLDSVFPQSTDLAIRREGSKLIGPGIGDNAIALACMLEIARSLVDEAGLNGSVWFVANVREEGLGNLQGMHKVVDRFGGQVSAYIVLEGMGLGHIYHRGLQVQRYRITVETQGGHAWIHAGRESAIHTLLRVGADIVSLPHPEDVATSLNIGSIRGGTSINTIANLASFDLDLRSEAPEFLDELEQDLETICKRHHTDGALIRIEKIGHRPGGSIPPDHELVRLTCEAFKAAEVTECKRGIASTDANVPLSKGYPAVCIGLTQGGHAHTLEEYIDLQTVTNGFKALSHLIPRALELPTISP